MLGPLNQHSMTETKKSQLSAKAESAQSPDKSIKSSLTVMMNLTDSSLASEILMTDAPETLQSQRQGVLTAVVTAFSKGKAHQAVGLLDTCGNRAVVRQGSKFILGKKAAMRAARELSDRGEDSRLLKAALKKAKVRVNTVNGSSENTLAFIRVKIHGVETPTLAIVVPAQNLKSGEVLIDNDTLAHTGINLQKLQAQRKAALGDNPLVSFDVTDPIGPGDEGYKEATAPGSDKTRGSTIGQPLPGEWLGYLEDHEQISPELGEVPTALVETKSLAEAMQADIYLSEMQCKRLLTDNPNLFKHKSYKISDVEISDKLTPEQAAEMRKSNLQLKDVFATSDKLPKQMTHATPAELQTKPGSTPHQAPCPRWGAWQSRLLRAWAQRGVDEGLLVHAPEGCQFANRPHVVLKAGGQSARVCGDYVKMNESLIKRPVNLPNMEDQLRRHKGAKYFTQADALKGYLAVPLSQRSSQMCALWTPLGLMVPTRMCEGSRNAGSIYQEYTTRLVNSLPAEVRESVSNYMDDFLISGRTWKEYMRNHTAFIKACRDHGITLNPKKVKTGLSQAKLLGRTVSGNSITVHDDNLGALRHCDEPTNVSELRSFLGITNFANRHVKDYAIIAQPLTNLTRKGVPWKWSSEVKMAYQKLKEKVLENFKLHTPDPSKPLYLFTDASEQGMGAHLCQLKGDKPVADKDLHRVPEEDKLTIAFYSSSFDLAMQRKPVYYREAKAVIWGLEKAKHFIEQSPHEVIVATDHSPLQWIKNTNKGVVSAWLIENIAGTEYRIVYVPGKTNTTADALSRSPMVSPSKFNLAGASGTWDALLHHLPNEHKSDRNVCIWSAQHTSSMQRKVQAWRTPRNPVLAKSPRTLVNNASGFDLILCAPVAEEAPIVAHSLLKDHNSTTSIAVLVPTDLLGYISTGGDPKTPEGTVERISKIVENCAKIAFASSNFTWILHNLREEVGDKVYTTERISAVNHFLHTSLLGEVPSHQYSVNVEFVDRIDAEVHGPNPFEDELSSWVALQQSELEFIKQAYKGKWLTNPNGLILIDDTPTGNKVYVPKSERRKLVMRIHKEMAHGMATRVRKSLTCKFIWPHMIRDIHSWLSECPECPLAKAKKSISHNQYSPTEYRRPRNAYGIDFYGIAKSKRGYVGVLTVVDLFTRWVDYIPVKSVNAEAFTRAMLESIVWKRGAFGILCSDGANAFVGKVAKQLATLLHIDKISTYHYPQGNSTAERNHVLLGEFLRLLPSHKRDVWEEEIGAVAYAANMSTNSSTGFSPFELDCGYQPSSTADLMFQDRPVPELDERVLYKTTAEQKQWLERVKSMHEIARRYDSASKEATKNRLNNDSGTKRSFTMGEKVIAYVPVQPKKKTKPDESVWKTKHMLHWRRATVVKKISNTTYVVRDTKGTDFQRHVSLLMKDKSETPLPGEKSETPDPEEKSDHPWPLGTIVGVKDDDAKPDTCAIARIVSYEENGEAKAQYYGTMAKNPEQGLYKPAWTTSKNEVMLGWNKDQLKRYKVNPWYVTVSPDMIVGQIKLDKGKLSLESRTMLTAEKLKTETLYVEKTDKKRKMPKQTSEQSIKRIKRSKNKSSSKKRSSKTTYSLRQRNR